MKKINNKQMFDNKLNFYVPRLSAYNYKKGSEGKAYFVGKDYVIKEFADKKMELTFFERYCKEIRKFSYMGLSVPKVYSWLAVPTLSGSGEKANIFYIMEERVNGDVLYEPTLSSIYSKCNGFCSFAEFNLALKNKLDNLPLFEKILEAYFKRFLTENSKLEALPNAETYKFLETYYSMKKKSIYSEPDFNPGNIILNNKYIKLIDNGIVGKVEYRKSLDEIKYQTIEEVFDLFSENNNMQDFFDIYLEDAKLSDNPSLRKLIEQNHKIFDIVLNKWINIMFELVGDFKISKIEYNNFLSQAVNLLGEQKGFEICEQFQRE